MHTLHRRILLKTYQLFDLVIMVGWFIIGVAVEALLVAHISFNDFIAMRIKAQNFVLFIGFIYAWHLIFRAFSLYQTRRLSSRRQEILDVLKAISLGVGLIAACATVFRIKLATPVFLAVFWVGTAGTTIAARLALRALLVSLRRRGHNLRHLVIVGINRRAIEFARKASSKAELGYLVAGFVDQKNRAGMQEFTKTGYHYLTDFEGFPAYLREHVVDEVAMFLPVKSLYREASTIIDTCEMHGIIVRLSADLFHLKVAKSGVEQIEGVQLLTIYTGTAAGFSLLIKRLLDISLSLVLLVFFFPFFILVPLLIKAASPGPIFFGQERVGLNKRRFKLYKFRTMVSDAEEQLADLEAFNEASGPVFKIKNDPRITPVGRFLRKMSIDELPQLFNVLKGDMSLVGPRPLPVRDYEGFDEDWHRRRFSVRPGITCLWQVNGRSNTTFNKWMEMDMEYIDNWSLSLDLKILAKTIPAVLRGSGAA
jgi:exopolysaccharide biosynthesis polyprenyl glycosylphosphotransferase